MADLYGFQEHRNHRGGHAYRVLQAAALIELYRRDAGHPPHSVDDLVAWQAVRSDLPRPIDPFAILTDEQLVLELAAIERAV